jgi:ABC-2 type transport system permease protein
VQGDEAVVCLWTHSLQGLGIEIILRPSKFRGEIVAIGAAVRKLCGSSKVMRQLVTIAWNAFMELVRQPVFLLLTTASASFNIFLAAVPYFGFGDDQKMVKDSVLAVTFLAGLLGAVLSASASVAHEIRTGTALAVLAKPVSRVQFILGKYFGLAGAITLMTFINFVSVLLVSRMAFDAYGDADKLGILIFALCVALAYLAGGFTNYFLRRPFVADTVFYLTGAMILAFVAINLIDKEGNMQAFAKDVDWRLVPATMLILFGLWVVSAIALACSTRLETIPTLAICSGIFLLGLMSDYLFGRTAIDATASALARWGSSFMHTITPNIALFWMADALEKGKSIPWNYVCKAFVYVAAYLTAALSLALMLFEDRELS